jgi:hypothetical protein
VQVISEIKFLMRGHRFISFVKVDCSQNSVSHSLANLVRSEDHTVMW